MDQADILEALDILDRLLAHLAALERILTVRTDPCDPTVIIYPDAEVPSEPGRSS
jgi:hypothetical protein